MARGFDFAASFATVATAQEIDWQKVDDAFGRKPAISGDVHRYGFPRTDLIVTLDGVTIKPAQQSSCKVCSEQQAACMKNYAGSTCKSEYKMCIKSCGKK